MSTVFQRPRFQTLFIQLLTLFIPCTSNRVVQGQRLQSAPLFQPRRTLYIAFQLCLFGKRVPCQAKFLRHHEISSLALHDTRASSQSTTLRGDQVGQKSHCRVRSLNHQTFLFFTQSCTCCIDFHWMNRLRRTTSARMVQDISEHLR